MSLPGYGRKGFLRWGEKLSIFYVIEYQYYIF
jgi:hypothetical protein